MSFLSLLLVSAFLTSAPQPKHPDRRTAAVRGEWSSQTISLFNTWGALDYNPKRKLDYPSPDGKKKIVVRGGAVVIKINDKQYKTNFGTKTSAELGWSPDSQYFFLTWTDSGETGTWHTELYTVGDSGFKKSHSSKIRSALTLSVGFVTYRWIKASLDQRHANFGQKQFTVMQISSVRNG